ncbi:MAG: hypothetical protein OEW46_12420, partial [Actinomycetota bacterium]|nr:hypothetical protein [Actinomycetota bacterium]
FELERVGGGRDLDAPVRVSRVAGRSEAEHLFDVFLWSCSPRASQTRPLASPARRTRRRPV